ncbi:MAG: hypothetical protein ACYS91_20285 [Planctomycetota bacterium]|jgi:hypothetical protein
MLKKYKNGFIKLITKQGLDPKDFKVEERKTRYTFTFAIQFIDIPLKFEVQNISRSHHHFKCYFVNFEPGFPKNYVHSIKKKDKYHYLDINNVYTVFEEWLVDSILQYVDESFQPDLWKQIENQTRLITAKKISEEESVPFLEDEKTQLKLSINEFRLIVNKTFGPSQEELKIIENRLDYLSDALDRLNRLDWRSLAFTTIISISIALTLDTEKGKVLFNLFKQVFSKLLYLLQ